MPLVNTAGTAALGRHSLPAEANFRQRRSFSVRAM
jgi:hypothetical protein